MLDHNNWQPLERNPDTQELFLRLRKRRDMIITPPRPEDVDNLFKTLNDPRVYNWMETTPKPYLRGARMFFMSEKKSSGHNYAEHAKAAWSESRKSADDAIKELEKASREHPPKLVDVCPFRFVRKVHGDGTDEFVGYVIVCKCPHGELMDTDTVDWERKAENEAKNASKLPGDPTIVWTVRGMVPLPCSFSHSSNQPG